MKSIMRRIGTVLLACMMLAALCAPAMAADLDEVRASVADVKITQYYLGTANNSAQHNYTYADEATVSYEATLSMTEIMATFLQARQTQLCNGQFMVHINCDATNGLVDDLLEPAAAGKAVTFTSKFLKPVGVSVKPVYADGEFSYTLPLDGYWAGKTVTGSGIEISFPVELILYYDGTDAYGVSDLYTGGTLKSGVDGTLLPIYGAFTVADWMKPVKLGLGEFRVKDSVKATVTEDSATWKQITAYGTIDGTFDYAHEPAELSKIPGLMSSHGAHVAFGTEASGIAAWKSNSVVLKLCRYVVEEPLPKALNTDDHYAYIIGYPDGTVCPERTISRAEVATIFFRMLTDECRNEGWKTTNAFSDVHENDWFNNAISTLNNMGIINGYPDGTFRPNVSITRAEFASIAVRFFETTTEIDGDAFSDISGHWARENINLASALHLVNGYPDGTFNPEAFIKRAEAMTIVNNTLRRSPVKGGLLPVSDMITWSDNADAAAWYYEAVQEATNSHDYTRGTNGAETWTKIQPVRDWVKFEKEWSDRNAASNPGEVVKVGDTVLD